MDTQNTAFHHIAIRVCDFDVSLKFYTDVLEAKTIATWDHWKGFKACMMELPGGGIIEMLGSGEDSLPENFECVSGCIIHLALQVNDVEAAVKKAVEHGATQKGEIKDNYVPIPLHVGAVYGPSGEIIEFLRPI